MALPSDQPNFVLIPFMAPGHIIPMIDMAKLLAKCGITVTIMVTPLDATRFSSVIDRAVGSGLSIQLLQIRFPCQEAGLPPGCESADSLPTYDLMHNFFVAINMLQKPVEEILKGLKPSPGCIVCDKHIPWTAETCNKFQIPRIIFDGMSCFTQLATHNLYISKIHETVPASVPFVVPGLPDKIEFTRLQLPGLFNPGSRDFTDLREQVRKTESQAYGVVVNSFEELESRYVHEFKKLKGGNVWCVGPLSLSSNDSFDRAQRGNQASIDSDQCLKWLDNRKPGSVIYACLGSLSRLSPAQFIELALGLEESGHPFILVVKGGSKSEEIEEWILDDGIEVRTKERGLFIRGWAPQVLILSHSAVGGFLTHCGWNSTLEGISAGVPMITWPMFAEQFLNEKLVVQILETGVRVGAQAVIHLGEEEKPEMMVMRDGIKEAVLRVMDEGQEACERRKRAQKLGDMAKRSIQGGGSSSLNIKLLVQDIERLMKNKTITLNYYTGV
ncbi:UNVERIFIED_CONTAM: UDP-glycosyltransferase 73C3 [Sesamum radiatum]|uniref:Glycosyltransferase n=1 Tax=Sesamum radiatum TaxID=300843 RepID=A0AAW2LAP5_SESRA